MKWRKQAWNWLKLAVYIIVGFYLLFGIACGIWLGYGLFEGLRDIPD